MRDGITRADFSRMIAGAAALIRAQHAMLSQLDSASGDGDRKIFTVEASKATDFKDKDASQESWNLPQHWCSRVSF